jgi:hypothetical protein
MGIGKLFVTGENSQELFARLLCLTSNLSEIQKLKKRLTCIPIEAGLENPQSA